MKPLSICRQTNFEDISELTLRRGSVRVTIKLNTPPQLAEVDQQIDRLTAVLMNLEHSLDKLEEDYFRDVTSEAEPPSEAGDLDETWVALHKEYNEEIDVKDDEYEALLRRFTAQPV
jgi:uncharacterized coiled-coil protein SlyX